MSDPAEVPVDITVYVPCLNEESNIGPTIEALASVVRDRGLRAEILVYDDGSTDATAERAAEALERAGSLDAGLRHELIRLESPRGLGANFFDGARRGVGERYMLVNGDGSERIETLRHVLERLGDADLVVTVFAAEGEGQSDEPRTGDRRGWARRRLSELFTALVNRLNGHRLRYYNGPTLHPREDVVRWATDCRGFAYQAELLTRQLDAGRSYVEVPMVNRQRESGVTKAFALRNLLSVARSLWRIRTRRFGPSPFAVEGSQGSVRPPRPWPVLGVLGLLLPLLLGAVLRLPALDRSDLRSGELPFFAGLVGDPGPAQLVSLTHARFTQSRQLPGPFLVASLGSWFVDPDASNLVRYRLAFAVVGTLTVAALWWLGYELGGLSLAALLALLGAVNPFDIFWSRFAQVFAPTLLFTTLVYAGVLRMARQIRVGGRASSRLGAATTAFACLAAAFHLGSWIALALAWALPWVAWFRANRHPDGADGAPAQVSAPWLWPTLWLVFLLPWLLSLPTPRFGGDGALFASATSEQYWQRLADLWRLPFVYTFGSGWRTPLSVGLPALALFLPGSRSTARPLAASALLLFALLTAVQSVGGIPSLPEYAPVWPLLLAWTGLGAQALGNAIRSRLVGDGGELSRERWAPVALASAGLALLGLVQWSPIHALLHLRGAPVEYARLVEALDELAAPGAPALINGRTVAERELAPYLLENAIPTFTIDDAGFDQWYWGGWRASAEEFLTQYGDALLVQQGRNFYDDPRVGPWEFPEEYFARRVVLENEPAQRLARLGIAPSEDFYGSRVVTEISYNRPEDLVARARAEGRQALALWGAGWGYRKDEELSAWRVLEDRAEVLLHNLGETPLVVDLLLDVRSGSGLKQVWIASQKLEIPPGLENQQLRIRQALPAGEQTLALVDPLFELGAVPLLVESMTVRVAESPRGQGAGAPP